MVELAPGWHSDVDRGPDWLFIRLRHVDAHGDQEPPLAEGLWATIAQHFTYRVVLELDDVGVLYSQLVGQLAALHKRVHTHGGILRICGLSDENQNVLRACRLEGRFPQYRNREEAVRGYRPPQPR